MKSEQVLKVVLPTCLALVATLAFLGFVQGNQAQTAQTDNGLVTQANSVLQVKADQGDTLANQISRACEEGGQTAKDLQNKFGACAQATVVKQSVPVPGPTGQNGQNGLNGQPGRGIVNTDVRDGHLFVRYTDGIIEDKGQVVGADGKVGAGGRGISSTSIAAGHLILIYTDGATVDAGQVVGKDGTNGTNGTNGNNGRGIAKTTITGSYHLVLTYTDGTSEDVGALPPGPAGPKGETGGVGKDGNPPSGWTVRNIDGTTTTCHRADPFDFQSPYYDCVQESGVTSTTPSGLGLTVPTR